MPERLGICQGEVCTKVVSSLGASLLSTLATTPFEVVKTRMIAQAASVTQTVASESFVQKYAFAGCPNMCHAMGHSRLAALCPPECYLYLSTADAMKKIYRQEGMGVLWRGTRETMMMSLPMVGLYLPIYDYLLDRMSDLGPAAPIASGSIARTVSMFCVTPIDIMRVRLQSIRAVTQEEMSLRSFDWGQGQGPLKKASALWRGFGATMVRDVPFTAVYWGLLEPMRRRLMEKDKGETSLTGVLYANSLAGFTAGIIASFFTHPMDVLKTRIQISQESGKSRPNLVPLAREIYKKEGVQGLFAGVGARTMRIGPSCAIVISTYELFKRIL